MAKFFMAATNLAGGRAVIRGRDADHIRVLRMRPGEEIIISDGEGTDYVGRIVQEKQDRGLTKCTPSLQTHPAHPFAS